MALLKRILGPLAVILAAVSLAYGEQIALDHFGYLNNDEAPAIIDQTEAQDLLNVELTHSGKSIRKRDGYGLFKTLPTSQAIRGGYHFFDSTGNDVQIWGSSTSLYGIVTDGTPTQLISSATLNATWDCADTQGNAYCVNSSRNALIKTNGVTKTWYTSPLGTMVAVTPERLLIAGVSGSESTIFYSQANNFTNFTTGLNPTDSSSEQISAPGSRLTHIEYACGRWLWWKDASFGFITGTDQTNLQIKTVSNTIGTLDNSSAIDPYGNVYFRAQDGHIYQYDCNSLKKLTQNISPTIQGSASRVSNLWTQTTQADFQGGVSVPTNNTSTTISPGDVIVSSFSNIDSTAATFRSGSHSNTMISGNTVIISTDAAELSNNSFETGSVSNWTLTQTGTAGSSFAQSSADAQSGSKSLLLNAPGDGSTSNAFLLTIEILDSSGNSLQTATYASGSVFSTSWAQDTYTVSSYLRRPIKIKITVTKQTCTGGTCTSGQSGTATSDTFLSNGATSITIYTKAPDIHNAYIDVIGGTPRSSITSGTYTSQVFDTSFTSSTVLLQTGYTANTSTPSFSVETATTSAGNWTSIMTSTGINRSGNRFLRYKTTFTIGSTDWANTSLTSATLVATSTGTYYSAVKNAPNISAWDTFNATVANNGGTHTFYVRSSNSSFAATAAAPSWIAQTNNAVVATSTGTYFQMRDDFAITTATDTPTLSNFTFNWYEGFASDKAYAIYFDNFVWWSLAYGSGQSTNNYIFRYDTINDGWTLSDIGTGGMLVENNQLYFGTSASTGKLYRYGNATNDDGTAINAYWKSKDFPGQDPWLENEYFQLDTYIRRNAGESLTIAYALNGSTTTTSYTASLSNTTDTIIRNKKLLPTGKIGGTINIKFSDSSTTSSWELLGFRLSYRPLPYKPTQ